MSILLWPLGGVVALIADPEYVTFIGSVPIVTTGPTRTFVTTFPGSQFVTSFTGLNPPAGMTGSGLSITQPYHLSLFDLSDFRNILKL